MCLQALTGNIRMAHKKAIRNSFIGAIFSLFLMSCSFSTEVSGVIRDEKGAGVGGAKIFLIYEGYVSESTSGPDGEFSVTASHLRGSDLLLLISKDGKKLFGMSIDSKESHVKADVVLKDGSQMEIETPTQNAAKNAFLNK